MSSQPWTLLNENLTLGAISSDGRIVYAYTSTNCYFSSNFGVSFTELLDNTTSLSNIQTISTSSDGKATVIGGINTPIYRVTLTQTYNATVIADPIVGVWYASGCDSDGSNMIIAGTSAIINGNFETRPICTYNAIDGWGLATTGYNVSSICYFTDNNNNVYYSFTNIIDNQILYALATDINSAQIYSVPNDITFLKICSATDNSPIYALGKDTSNFIALYTSSGISSFFTLSNAITASLNWTDISCSQNGVYVSITETGGNVYISENSGVSFTPYATTQAWNNTRISNDGETIYASSSSGLSQSTDGGISCFEENTFILTDNGYKKINELTIGSIIYTTEGYKKIILLGYNYAHSKHFKEFKNVNEFNSLILSIGHAVLFDDLDYVKFKKEKYNIEFYKHAQKINGLNQLLVDDCILFTPLNKSGVIKYYHFVLENDDIYKQYGVYANGVLCECMSENFYKFANLLDV